MWFKSDAPTITIKTVQESWDDSKMSQESGIPIHNFDEQWDSKAR